MIFSYDGKEYVISFEYSEGDIPNTELRGRVTRCWVVKAGDDRQYSVLKGTAWCHPNDQFAREIGRKLALERALVTALALRVKARAREFRTAAWKAYWGRKRSNEGQGI